MPPARHTRNNASTKDSHGYQEGVAKRRSTRLTAATNTIPGNVVDGKEAKGKEQPCPRVGGKPEAHEVQPHHPMPYPLGLFSRYEYVGHGRIEWKDVGVAGIAIASTEKEQALKALGFVLQAACDIVGRHPSSLDHNRDIIWDWRSIELSANAYGAFACAMVNHKSLEYDTQNVSYDWTPIDSLRGTLSVRKECNFQSELTQQLSDVINEALSKNKLLTSLVRYVELESRIPTPVLTGIVEGLRMPCRCWRYEQSDKGKAEQKEEDEEKDKEEEACVTVLGLMTMVGDKHDMLPGDLLPYICTFHASLHLHFCTFQALLHGMLLCATWQGHEELFKRWILQIHSVSFFVQCLVCRLNPFDQSLEFIFFYTVTLSFQDYY